MQTPLRITFRHMDTSAAVEARVREHIDHLELFHKRIIGCHVIIEAPVGHARNGAPFHVTVDMTVPGHEVAVRSDRSRSDGHADVYVALRDAFDSVKRILHDQSLAPAHCGRTHDELLDVPEQLNATIGNARGQP